MPLKWYSSHVVNEGGMYFGEEIAWGIDGRMADGMFKFIKCKCGYMQGGTEKVYEIQYVVKL